MNNPVTTLNYCGVEYVIGSVGAFLKFTFDVPDNFTPMAAIQYLNANELKVIQRGLNSQIFELANQNFTLVLDASNNTTNDLIDRDTLVPWILQLAGSTWVASITPPPPVYQTWTGMKRQGSLTMTGNTNYDITFPTVIDASGDFSTTDNINFKCLTAGGYIAHIFMSSAVGTPQSPTYNWNGSRVRIISSSVESDNNWVQPSSYYGSLVWPQNQATTFCSLVLNETIKFSFADLRPVGAPTVVMNCFMFIVRVTPVY